MPAATTEEISLWHHRRKGSSINVTFLKWPIVYRTRKRVKEIIPFSFSFPSQSIPFSKRYHSRYGLVWRTHVVFHGSPQFFAQLRPYVRIISVIGFCFCFFSFWRFLSILSGRYTFRAQTRLIYSSEDFFPHCCMNSYLVAGYRAKNIFLQF